MRYFLFFFFSFSLLTSGVAQDDYVDQSFFKYEDRVYKDYITSVRFNINGLEISTPIVDINGGQLLLSFDDIEGDSRTFYYTIIHCDRNWKPSEDITDMDYIDGFTEGEILNFDFSANTRAIYTNYQLLLPNDDIKWKLSGNYLLKVYTDEGSDDIVLTRRFTVTESKLKIDSQVTRAFDIGKYNTHQELDFIIDMKAFPISNPKNEMSVTVLQNGNWGSAIENIQPMFIKGNILEYNYQGKIVFPGLKEFRDLDMRSLRFGSGKIKDVYPTQDHFEAELMTEISRQDEAYFFEKDANGAFFFENFEEDQANIESDYAYVTFNYKSTFPVEDGSIYVVGRITDWQPREEFKLKYNKETDSYTTTAYMKQGYYDYLYAFVPNGTERTEFDTTEGNWHETENEYTILVYYQPFGARYDRVIGLATRNSVN